MDLIRTSSASEQWHRTPPSGMKPRLQKMHDLKGGDGLAYPMYIYVWFRV